MGKASRAKAERRSATDAKQGAPPSRRPSIFAITLGLLAVAALVTVIATNVLRDDASSGASVSDAEVYADVDVNGAALPTAPEDPKGDDIGEGEGLPTMTGTSITGEPLTIGPDNGPALVMVVAHWCQHCQVEVPRVVDHLKQSPLPDGVKLLAVSTSASSKQPNFPPSKWLDEEGWTHPTLVDDEIGSAAEALGVSGFPMMIFIDADGRVDSRVSGEVSMADMDKRLASITP